MTDGIGTTQYSYVPVGSPGALSTSVEAGPLAGASITYAYDALGRVSTRTVAGSGAETVQYDAIGRVIAKINDMGSFTLSYLGQTGQITLRQLASSTLSTTWTYLNNVGDRRLASIANVGLTAGHFSTYTYTTAPENILSSITESSDAATVYPTQAQQTAGYNTLNQLETLQGQPTLTYNANGNLVADDQRTYTWDAEDRLIGISYPGQPGKQTAFTYDGLGRRVTIASTPPGGGSTTTTSYVWCGSDMCQARDATNAVARSYYGEGEFVPGTPAQHLYYGPDQLGSVRRVFASAVNAPAYSFDSYGHPLQITAPVTDFGYAGMFYNLDSGLYLTNYRAYDPVLGRWLSRDPIGEASDRSANLYAYVSGNPISRTDSLGLHESHWLLRALVPGQIPWDNGLTACAAGDYGMAAAHFTTMAAEMVLTVMTAGGYYEIRTVVRPLIVEGMTGTRAISPIVRFGDNPNQAYHAFRHTDAAGLNRSVVESAIRQDLAPRLPIPSGSNTFSVNVNGVQVQYNAHLRTNGTINIGRITPPK